MTVRPSNCGVWGRPYRLVRWCLSLSLLVCLPGCSSCRREQPPEAAKKKAEVKPDFEVTSAVVQPADATFTQLAVKPGHYVTVTQDFRANNYDFKGELETATLDSFNKPLPIPGTDFEMQVIRPVILAKGMTKQFETLYFIPAGEEAAKRQVKLSRELVSARGSRLVLESGETVGVAGIMPDYQYMLVVLAAQPRSYGYLKQLDAIRPALDLFSAGDMTEEGTLSYYRVAIRDPEARGLVPSHPFAWTGIAYLFWDGLDPSRLTVEEQQALLDWLHWGGQLIVSGPRSLSLLRGSFLAPYLPAEAGRAVQLAQADFAELDAFWSVRRAGKALGLSIPAAEPILGVRLAPHPAARTLEGTGGLVVERPVGSGRVVATAFSLDDPLLVNWRSFDGFVNGALLRRPGREFRVQPSQVVGEIRFRGPYAGAERHPCVGSSVRYFTRDVADREPVATKSRRRGEGALAADWRFGGYAAQPRAGMAGWHDHSGAANEARAALLAAAGISIPQASFVLRTLAIYLLLLVPVNWTVFRLLGHVEWAWLAAPLLAVIAAVVVVRQAQLDIGFARSRNEIVVAEAHADYSRAHLTRYTALYTSLATRYDLSLSDPQAVGQPFPVGGQQALRIGSRPTIRFERDVRAVLSGYRLESNKTGIVHTEQMYELGGTFRLEGTDGGRQRVVNGTPQTLQDAGLLWRTPQGVLKTAWLGELPGGAARELTWDDAVASRPWLTQWNQSVITVSCQREARELLAEWDQDGDRRLTPAELRRRPDLVAEAQRQLDGRRPLAIDEGELAAVVQRLRAGQISLGGLMELASGELGLQRGQMRLLGWTGQDLPGLEISPQAAQESVRTLFLVHLQPASWPEPSPDANSILEVRDQVEAISRPDDEWAPPPEPPATTPPGGTAAN